MSLADVALKVSRDRPSAKSTGSIPNIIEFIEAPWGLNPQGKFNLFPVQRVILKAHYGIALDENPYGFDLVQPVPEDHPNYDSNLVDIDGYYKYRVPITDHLRQNSRVFSEADYLRFLFDEGRCNIREVVVGQERRHMILSIGRRSGKTLISACVAAYETYKLLKRGDPQGYYGLPASNPIQIISVATSKDQAGFLYSEVSGHYQNCSFFKKFMANNTQSYAKFQSPADIERFGAYNEDPTAKSGIKVTFMPCAAKGLRGGGNIVVILDEFAHFNDSGQSSAEDIYDAVVPSTAAFSPKDPRDTRKDIGEVEGRVIAISSPLGKGNYFYKLYEQGMKGMDNMICFQAPTWEVNPTVPASFLKLQHAKNPSVFMQEFGGEFNDQASGWIDNREDLLQCIDPSLRPVQRGIPRRSYFMGLDVGLKGDGTAAAIGHVEGEHIVLDWVGQLKAGEGDYADSDRLDFEEVAKWVRDLAGKYYILDGVADQYHGIAFEQALAKLGVRRIRMVKMSRQLNSDIYTNLKHLMWDQRLRLYDFPKPAEAEHSPLIREMLDLQVKYFSKHLIKVEAPRGIGKHDDMSDAVARMVWSATHHMNNSNIVSGHSSGSGGRPSHSLHNERVAVARARARSRLGGSHAGRRQRQVKRRG